MARSSLARRLGAASLLTTLVLATASCGSDSDDTATDESSSSETSTDDSVEEETDEPEAGALEELPAEEFYPALMAAMQEAESMAFAITSTGTTEMSGVMEYGDNGLAMQASNSGADAMEIILVDQVVYMSGDMGLPEGKKWLKFDMSDPSSPFGQLGKSIDPTYMIKAMEAPKKFEVLGTEEVDGVETNHYNIVMDTATYAEALELPAGMAEFMPKEIAVEMWVDADDRLRKFHQDLEIPDLMGTGKPTKTTTDGTYYDFGTDVDIEAPPAAEVTDEIPGMS